MYDCCRQYKKCPIIKESGREKAKRNITNYCETVAAVMLVKRTQRGYPEIVIVTNLLSQVRSLKSTARVTQDTCARVP